MTPATDDTASTKAVVDFYDPLAEQYHLVHKDWDASVREQGQSLDRLIKAQRGDAPQRVLDCSCGIGTQCLGLAALGHRVHATDLSPGAVARADREARQRGLKMTFGVADMRALEAEVDGTFDVVISCDNSLAHMMTGDDLDRAATSLAAKARPGGMVLVSLRDYDTLIESKPAVAPASIFDEPDARRVVFQLWDWQPGGESYRTTLFIVHQKDGEWTMSHFDSTLRAWRRAAVTAALEAAGLVDVAWHMPGDEGYFQPAAICRKPNEG